VENEDVREILYLVQRTVLLDPRDEAFEHRQCSGDDHPCRVLVFLDELAGLQYTNHK
jgi:hypothetical protein